MPGGFSYGDYLRSGAISALAPVMQSVIDRAKQGMPVLGICNGFQILTESHLLPGSMIKNDHLHFICRDQELVVESTDTVWTRDFEQGQTITVPLKNQDGQYVADEATLDELLSVENLLRPRYRDAHHYSGSDPSYSKADSADSAGSGADGAGSAGR